MERHSGEDRKMGPRKKIDDKSDADNELHHLKCDQATSVREQHATSRPESCSNVWM